jgi:hypothetical protein
VLKQASRVVVDPPEIEEPVRRDALDGRAPEYRDSAAQQQPNQSSPPPPCHVHAWFHTTRIPAAWDRRQVREGYECDQKRGSKKHGRERSGNSDAPRISPVQLQGEQ